MLSVPLIVNDSELILTNEGSNSATVEVIVPYDESLAYMTLYVGGWIGGVLIYPAEHPEVPSLVATSVSRTRLAEGHAEQYAKLTVNYSPRQPEHTSGNLPSITTSVAVEQLGLKNKQYKWTSGPLNDEDLTDDDVSPGIKATYADFSLSWKGLDFFDMAGAMDMAGKINNTDFNLPDGTTYPAWSVLFIAPEQNVNWSTDPMSGTLFPTYDVSYKFQYARQDRRTLPCIDGNSLTYETVDPQPAEDTDLNALFSLGF